MRKIWNTTSIKLVINMSTKPGKVKKLINFINNNNKSKNIAQNLYKLDTFLFTYNIQKDVRVRSNHLNPGYNINNFKTKARVIVKFQLHSRNFKATKKQTQPKLTFFIILKSIWLIRLIHQRYLLWKSIALELMSWCWHFHKSSRLV